MTDSKVYFFCTATYKLFDTDELFAMDFIDSSGFNPRDVLAISERTYKVLKDIPPKELSDFMRISKDTKEMIRSFDKTFTMQAEEKQKCLN